MVLPALLCSGYRWYEKGLCCVVSGGVHLRTRKAPPSHRDGSLCSLLAAVGPA